jgi:hypothetical protein
VLVSILATSQFEAVEAPVTIRNLVYVTLLDESGECP